jgi:hypothetical protein
MTHFAATMTTEHLTHFDATGQAHMVDVGAKAETHRIALTGSIRMKPETLAIILSGTAKKGDVLGIARIAAIMASKRTADLIPVPPAGPDPRGGRVRNRRRQFQRPLQRPRSKPTARPASKWKR